MFADSKGRLDVVSFGDIAQRGGSVRQFTRHFWNDGTLLNMKCMSNHLAEKRLTVGFFSMKIGLILFV